MIFNNIDATKNKCESKKVKKKNLHSIISTETKNMINLNKFWYIINILTLQHGRRHCTTFILFFMVDITAYIPYFFIIFPYVFLFFLIFILILYRFYSKINKRYHFIYEIANIYPYNYIIRNIRPSLLSILKANLLLIGQCIW